MILELLFEFILLFLDLIFGWVSFPQIPDTIIYYVDYLFTYMGMGMRFISLFVNMELVKVCLPIILLVENFDKLYSVVMWILKKIPFLGMQ